MYSAKTSYGGLLFAGIGFAGSNTGGAPVLALITHDDSTCLPFFQNANLLCWTSKTRQLPGRYEFKEGQHRSNQSEPGDRQRDEQ